MPFSAASMSCSRSRSWAARFSAARVGSSTVEKMTSAAIFTKMPKKLHEKPLSMYETERLRIEIHMRRRDHTAALRWMLLRRDLPSLRLIIASASVPMSSTMERAMTKVLVLSSAMPA